MANRIIYYLLISWLATVFFTFTILIPFIGFSVIFLLFFSCISIVSLLSTNSRKIFFMANIAILLITLGNCLPIHNNLYRSISFLIFWLPAFLLMIPLIYTKTNDTHTDKYDVLLLFLSISPAIILTLFNFF